jgi:AraC-like DNA-binding protein
MDKSFYHEQLLKISGEVYSREDVCDKVVEAKRFIDEHYYTNISLDDMAAKACMSKFHFIRLFKKIYGVTPNQYLVSVRLENAKALLQSGATVTTACFSVGFDSTTTFAGLFKKMTGDTPSKVHNKPIPGAAVPPYIYLEAFTKKQF